VFTALFARLHLGIYTLRTVLFLARLWVSTFSVGIKTITSRLINRLITTLALGLAILNMRGTNLPSYMGARDIPPHQAQAVDDRYEMENEMKHTGTT
jgi:hypothetical protein